MPPAADFFVNVLKIEGTPVAETIPEQDELPYAILHIVHPAEVAARPGFVVFKVCRLNYESGKGDSVLLEDFSGLVFGVEFERAIRIKNVHGVVWPIFVKGGFFIEQDIGWCGGV